MARLAPEKADFAPALPNLIDKCGITCEVVMKTKKYPSKSFLDSILEYDKISGLFTWKVRPVSTFKSRNESSAKKWNTRYAKTPAGSIRLGYLTIRINKNHYQSHRIAWIMTYGNEPDFIDHINQDKSDNRILNLRNVSHAENLRNMPKKKNNKSGVTGVHFEKQTGKWRAHIMVDGKSIKLGRFANLNDAKIARETAEVKYGFHTNHGKKRCATT